MSPLGRWVRAGPGCGDVVSELRVMECNRALTVPVCYIAWGRTWIVGCSRLKAPSDQWKLQGTDSDPRLDPRTQSRSSPQIYPSCGFLTSNGNSSFPVAQAEAPPHPWCVSPNPRPRIWSSCKSCGFDSSPACSHLSPSHPLSRLAVLFSPSRPGLLCLVPSLTCFSSILPTRQGYCCCSVTTLCQTLQPQGLQHVRLLCPPLFPGVCSDSCLLSWWCYQTTSCSVAPFSFCLQSFPAWGSQSIGA